MIEGKEVDNEKAKKDLDSRLNKWIEEGLSIHASLVAIDDGSLSVSDMQDVIVNGIGGLLFLNGGES